MTNTKRVRRGLLTTALLVGAAAVAPAQLGAQTITAVTPNPIPAPTGTAPVTLAISGTGLTGTGFLQPPVQPGYPSTCLPQQGSAPTVTVNQTAVTVQAGYTSTAVSVSVPASLLTPPSVTIVLGVTAYVNGVCSNPAPASATVPVAQKAVTTLNLAASPYPTSCGPVTLTATLRGVNGSVAAGATGTVTFVESNSFALLTLGTSPVSGGIATITLTNLGAYTHSIGAEYSGDSNNAASSSGYISETVAVAPTLSLAVSPNPAVAGQPVTMTATVSPNPGSGYTVTFLDGGTAIGTAATNASGVAVYTTSALAQGNHSLVAAFTGACGIAQSSAFTETVGSSVTQTTTVLSALPQQPTVCQPVTLTVAITPGAAGTVTFLDVTKKPATVLASNVPVTVGNGIAAAAINVQLPAEVGTLEADFTPSSPASYSASTGTASETVLQAPSTTQLTAVPATSTLGQSVALTATVAACTGIKPTGTITFADGETLIGTAPMTSSAATLSTSSLTVGTHALTATYGGDSNYTRSIGSATETVGLASTTTTLTASPSPAAIGQAVTLTATVTPAAATGTVTFTDGTVQLGQTAVSGGKATLTLSSLSVGSHALTASYSGDANYAKSSGTATESVGLNATTTTLSASPSSPTYGVTVTLTATVTASTVTGAAAPVAVTGTVTFLDGTTQLGQSTVSGGKATLAISTLTGGSHSLTATYGGDANYAISSGTASETVGLASTTTTLTASPSPSVFGQAVTLTAAVTPATATGTVTFTDGTTQLGQTAVSAGKATFTVSFLTVGTHALSATYSEDANYATSSGTASETVGLAATTTTLTVSPNPAAYGQTVTLTATVTPAAATGTVTFADGAVQLGQVAISGGKAAFTLSSPTAGIHSLTATYSGDANYSTSTSPPVSEVVALPTINLLVDNNQPPTPLVQPTPTLSLTQMYPVALSGTVTLSFQPAASVAGLPGAYTNGDVAFASGGTSAPVTIPPNSMTVPLPKIQVGTVAGTITATLGPLTPAGSTQALPFAGSGSAPSIPITLSPAKPLILSVKISSITSSGFQVVVNADSTTRDLSLAELVFTSASGTQLTGTTSFTGTSGISLSTAAPAWFSSTQGVANGGGFTLTIPFGYSGDTTALNTVQVTLSNSQGKSDPVSGGR